jgi:hypothetical protein
MNEIGPYECEEVWKILLPFVNTINAKDGVILAMDNRSPTPCLSPDTTLPRLRHWSDVAALQLLKVRSDYQMQCGKSVYH